MRRAIATALALGAVLAAVPGASAAGATCPNRLTWHATAYRSATTHGHIPLGRRLGKGTLASTCRTTHTTTTTPGGGYATRGRAAGIADATVLRVVFAVDGVRPQVAVAIGGAKPSLYVSKASATSAELRILSRIRHG